MGEIQSHVISHRVRGVSRGHDLNWFELNWFKLIWIIVEYQPIWQGRQRNRIVNKRGGRRKKEKERWKSWWWRIQGSSFILGPRLIWTHPYTRQLSDRIETENSAVHLIVVYRTTIKVQIKRGPCTHNEKTVTHIYSANQCNRIVTHIYSANQCNRIVNGRRRSWHAMPSDGHRLGVGSVVDWCT